MPVIQGGSFSCWNWRCLVAANLHLFEQLFSEVELLVATINQVGWYYYSKPLTNWFTYLTSFMVSFVFYFQILRMLQSRMSAKVRFLEISIFHFHFHLFLLLVLILKLLFNPFNSLAILDILLKITSQKKQLYFKVFDFLKWIYHLTNICSPIHPLFFEYLFII